MFSVEKRKELRGYRQYQERKQLGLCVRCGKAKMRKPGVVTCQICWDKEVKAQRDRRARKHTVHRLSQLG